MPIGPQRRVALLAVPLLVFVLCAWLMAPPLRADEPVRFGPHDLRSVFYVAKSENQNQIHYGMRLDAACRPLKGAPVFAYWRRLKHGVRVDEPLVGPGRRLYGASDEQRVSHNGPTGGSVNMYVKAIKRVHIEIRVQKAPSGCSATPYTAIRGEAARLSHAFLQLGRFGLTVDYVELIGHRTRDGAEVRERFR